MSKPYDKYHAFGEIRAPDDVLLVQGSPPILRRAPWSAIMSATATSTGAVGTQSAWKGPTFFSQLPVAGTVHVNDYVVGNQGEPPITCLFQVSDLQTATSTSTLTQSYSVTTRPQNLLSSELPYAIATSVSARDTVLTNQVDRDGITRTRLAWIFEAIGTYTGTFTDTTTGTGTGTGGLHTPPVVESSVVDPLSFGTAFTFSAPSGIVAGDLLIYLYFAHSAGAVIDTATSGLNWSTVAGYNDIGGKPVVVFAKQAEGGDVLRVTGGLDWRCAISLRISNGAVANIETGAALTSSNPSWYDPDPFSPSGGSDGYLWLAVVAAEPAFPSTGTFDFTVAPSGYTLIAGPQSTASNLPGVAVGHLRNTTDTEDPSAWTWAVSPAVSVVGHTFMITVRGTV